MKNSSRATPEKLLRHDAFLRGLAARLVMDPGLQEDAIQDTWVAALTTPPSDGTLRAWLATVLRNTVRKAHRTRTRRERREFLAARHDRLPGTLETIANDELRRDVVAAVLALPPNLRDVVIRRFYDNEPPRTIADGLSVSVGEVHNRLRRALRALRGDLGGRCPSWRVGLLAGLQSSASGSIGSASVSTSIGAIAMTTKSKLALTAALACLVGAATWYASVLRRPGGGNPEVVEQTEHLNDVRVSVANGTHDAPPTLAGADTNVRPPVAIDEHDAANESSKGKVIVKGHVLNERGAIVKGAAVFFRCRDRIIARATTNAQGVYSFRRGDFGRNLESASGFVVAKHKRVGIGVARLSISFDGPSRQKFRGITLFPPQQLRVRVVDPSGNPKPAHIWILGPNCDMATPIAIGQCDQRGVLTVESIPRGIWRVVAAHKGFGRTTRVIQVPATDGRPIEIKLSTPHELRVLVRDKQSLLPIANACVRVRVFNVHGSSVSWSEPISIPTECVTDSSGTCRIDELGSSDRVSLSVVAEGYPDATGYQRMVDQGYVEIDATAGETTIELEHGRTIRWPLVDNGYGIPEDGSTVIFRDSMRPGMETREGSIEGSVLISAEWDRTSFHPYYAIVSGYGATKVYPPPLGHEARPVVFSPLRSASIAVKHQDGSPAEGFNFHVACFSVRSGYQSTTRTDSNGHARIDGLIGERITCQLSQPPEEGNTWQLGAYPIDKSDAKIEYTIPPERHIRMFLKLNGKPIAEGTKGRVSFGATSSKFVVDRQGIADATFASAARGSRGSVRLRLADGTQAMGEALVDFDEPNPLRTTVALHRPLLVRADVRLPVDGRAKIALQLWDSSHELWRNERTQSVGADGFATFSFPRAGRFRVVDQSSGVASEAVDLNAHNSPLRIALDLADVTLIRGRVVLPEGARGYHNFTVSSDERSELVRDGSRLRLPGVAVHAGDGTFSIRVSGRDSVVIRPHHLRYRPHPTKGTASITSGSTNIELHVVEGTTASMDIRPPLERGAVALGGALLNVRLFPSGLEDASKATFGRLNNARNRIDIGGLDPGQYGAIWIDTLTALPKVLHDVDIKPGTNDLGTHSRKSGSTLRIRVVASDESASKETITVVATYQGTPAHRRHQVISEPGRVDIPGLSKGTYHVIAFAIGLAGPFGEILNETLTVDGTSDIERVIKLK